MMLSSLFAFLGGSAFRMIWGEVSHWLTEKQDQQHEMERMRLQGELDAAQHARNMEALRVQSELGVKTIQVQAEADLEKADAAGFFSAVETFMKPTGIMFVDAWNGIIRPLCATIAIVLWILALNRAGWIMTDWDKELVAGVLGFFFASREFAKRGK